MALGPNDARRMVDIALKHFQGLGYDGEDVVGAALDLRLMLKALDREVSEANRPIKEMFHRLIMEVESRVPSTSLTTNDAN